jgi:hypothetical protein
MIIDCDRCEVRGRACGDCVVGVFLGLPSVSDTAPERRDLPSGAHAMQLDAPERRALEALADQGLIPRLRLVAGEGGTASPTKSITGELSDAV